MSAADYYVDFTNGSDSNPGTDSGAPRKTCPVQGALQPGDTVFFHSGTVYGQTVLLKGGSPGNPVTFDGSSWGGGGRCVITKPGNEEGSGMLCYPDGVNYSHMVIRGFLFRDIGGYTESDPIWNEPAGGWNQAAHEVKRPPEGIGLGLKRGASDLVVENCKFEEIGQWQNVKPMSGTQSVTGVGIGVEEGSRNIRIEDCDFTRMKTGVLIKSRGGEPVEGITVRGCQFHNYMNWLIDIAPRSNDAVLRDITIEQCTLYDYKEHDRPNWEGWGDKPHQDGIFIRCSGFRSVWENVVIRNNLFFSDDGSEGGTASIFVSQGPSVDIYNNVFFDDSHTNAAINIGFANRTGQPQVLRVYHNTIVSGSRPIKLASSSGTNPDVLDVRNNLFYRQVPGSNDCWYFTALNDVGELTVDHNFYCSNNVPLEDTIAIYNGARLSFAEWQALGYDPNGRLVDPELISISGPPSTWNGRPSSAGSPLVNAGADLSAFLASDKDGNPRTGTFDVGAYEFQGDGGSSQRPPAIPALARAQAQSEDSILVTWQDASNNETSFEVEQSRVSGSGYEMVASLPAGSTSFVASGLEAGTVHYFRVRARNQFGYSAYSNIATETTLGEDDGEGGDGGFWFSIGDPVAATEGEIALPFEVVGDVVMQDLQTVGFDGGRATYRFEVTEVGDYAVAIEVMAPDEGSNSLFVDFDREPEVSYSVWHVPVTTGFVWQPVSWQGGGSPADPEFLPKFFELGPGIHQLVIRGREKATRFKSVKVVRRLSATHSAPRHP